MLRLYARHNNSEGSGQASVLAGQDSSPKTANRWFEDPQALIEAGTVELDSALRFQPPRRLQAERASIDLVSGLSRAPANVRAWAQLARARFALGDPAGALAAWRMSIRSGRFDPSLNLWRAEMGLSLWLILDADDRTKLADEIRFAALTDLNSLAALAKDHVLIATIVRAALTSEPQRAAAFEHAVTDSP